MIQKYESEDGVVFVSKTAHDDARMWKMTAWAHAEGQSINIHSTVGMYGSGEAAARIGLLMLREYQERK